MSRGPGARLLAVAAAVIALTGCASGPPESAVTGSDPPAPASLRPTVPPPIPRPLDASRYAGGEICELLTNEQAVRLGFLDDTPSPHSMGDFHSCTRDLSGPPSPAVIYDLDLADDVLDFPYETSRTKHEFNPLTILGQPAVQYSATDTGEPSSGCKIALGLAQRQGVTINVLFDSRDPCETAVAVGEQIVRNLGG